MTSPRTLAREIIWRRHTPMWSRNFNSNFSVFRSEALLPHDSRLKFQETQTRELIICKNSSKGHTASQLLNAMNITVFSTKLYDKRSFLAAVSQRTDAAHLHWHWLQDTLSTHTARFAKGSSAVCCFVNDTLDADCLQELAHHGVKLVCLRCAGFNQVDAL